MLNTWLTSSYVRHYPLSPAQTTDLHAIHAALNEQFSFQVGLRAEGQDRCRVHVEATGPSGWAVRVRRVGYVPLLHHNTPIESSPLDVEGVGFTPGYVPDPLFDDTDFLLPAEETHAFWITVKPGSKADPGPQEITVVVHPEGGEPQRHTVGVTLHPVRLRKRRNFAITHWFYVDSLIDWYGTDMFDQRFWDILEQYIRNVVEHGQDTLYVPVFTPPLDGVKRPSQLLRVNSSSKGEYGFDWRDVRRYIRLAKACGIKHFEWCHPFTQWGVKHAIRIYHGQGKDERLLWPTNTGATSPTYRTFLSQYLPKLKRFLEREGILKQSFFHLSDEPHGEEHLANYRKARALLKELAPWMKVMDALSGIEFADQGLTDMPIPSIRTALDFHAAGFTSWCYYCCGPREEFINRLLDTPLAKIAMHGVLFYRWPFKGFLHWGYNYWYESQTRNLIDPFTVQDGKAWARSWAYGDTFVVYPGPDGPIDSMRWEVFGESLQDFQLLQTLGISRDDPLLDDVRSFTDFPKAQQWRDKLRNALFARAEKQ